jgi:hypothetical protein
MKRAQKLLVSVLLAVSTLGAMAQGALAYDGGVWSNSDSFTSRCLGFTDTYPKQLYSLARTQLTALGYNPADGALGASFTRSAFLASVRPDWVVYVHSHGDNYRATSGSGIDSAFLQDPGTTACSDYKTDAIRSSAIKAATYPVPFNLVIVSTCYLGSSSSTMPGAFQIEKVKNSTDWEFYLGYVHETYDSDALRFEKAFWSYLAGSASHTAYQAFTYASGIGGYGQPDAADPFQANWWGNPNYNGRPS